MIKHQRLEYLDAIRGIAAFAVLLSHCWLLNSQVYRDSHGSINDAFHSASAFILYFASKFFGAGRSAVMIFFVLSGFVLARSLLEQKTGYLCYVTKRFFRIYPTFAFTVFTSFLLHRYIGVRHEMISNWVTSLNSPDVSWKVLFEHLMLLGTDKSLELNFVVWSLVYEMRISMMLPAVLKALCSYDWRALLVLFLISLGATILHFQTTGDVSEGYGELTVFDSIVTTVYFVFFFAAGAYLAVHCKRVKEKLNELSIFSKALLLMMVAYFLFKSNYNTHSLAGSVVDYLRALGAIGLISLTMSISALAKLLGGKLLVWLGRVSYSLYLVHLPILYAVNQTIGSSWSFAEISVCTIILSLIAAELTARLVEFPSIRFGKKVLAVIPA